MPRFTYQPGWAGEDSVLSILKAEALQPTAAELRQITESARRLENPDVYSPADVDCASCHLAAQALERVRTLQVVPTEGERLEGATPVDTSDLRAFGYMRNRAVVSQRVANETARALDACNRMLSKRLP